MLHVLFSVEFQLLNFNFKGCLVCSV